MTSRNLGCPTYYCTLTPWLARIHFFKNFPFLISMPHISRSCFFVLEKFVDSKKGYPSREMEPKCTRRFFIGTVRFWNPRKICIKSEYNNEFWILDFHISRSCFFVLEKKLWTLRRVIRAAKWSQNALAASLLVPYVSEIAARSLFVLWPRYKPTLRCF